MKLAWEQKSGRYVAIKMISRKAARQQARLETEILIQRNMMHANIVQLFEVLEDEQFHYLIMEFAAGGELFDKIRMQGMIVERITVW